MLKKIDEFLKIVSIIYCLISPFGYAWYALTYYESFFKSLDSLSDDAKNILCLFGGICVSIVFFVLACSYICISLIKKLLSRIKANQ